MDLRILTSLIAALTSLGLGILAYLKNREHPVNRRFFAFNFVLFFWNSSDFIGPYLYQFGLPAVWYYRGSYAGGILVIPFFLKLIAALSPEKSRGYFTKAMNIIVYIAAVFLFCILPSNLLIKGIVVTPTYQELPGPLYGIFSVYFAFGFFYYLTLLIKTYSSSSGLQKIRLKYFLAALFLGFICAVAAFISILSNYASGYVAFYTFEIAYTLVIFYAIIKHRLMDIEFVIWKHLVPIFVVPGVTVGSYLGYQWVHGLLPFLPTLGVGHLILALFFATIVFGATNLRPVKAGAEGIANWLFYRGKYAYHEQLREASNRIREAVGYEELADTFTKVLHETMGVEGYVFIHYPDQGGYFRTAQDPNLPIVRLNSQKSPLVQHLIRTQREILLDDLEKQTKGNAEEILIELNSLANKPWREIACVVPFVKRGELLGMVLLSGKPNHEAYNSDDLDLLAMLAGEVAILIENIQKGEELALERMKREKQYNEVTRRTVVELLNHDINNVASALMLLKDLTTKLFDGKLNLSEEKKQNYIGWIAQEVVTMKGLTEKSQTVAPPLKTYYEPTDLLTLLNDSSQRLTPLKRKYGVQLTFPGNTTTVPTTSPPSVATETPSHASTLHSSHPTIDPHLFAQLFDYLLGYLMTVTKSDTEIVTTLEPKGEALLVEIEGEGVINLDYFDEAQAVQAYYRTLEGGGIDTEDFRIGTAHRIASKKHRGNIRATVPKLGRYQVTVTIPYHHEDALSGMRRFIEQRRKQQESIPESEPQSKN